MKNFHACLLALTALLAGPAYSSSAQAQRADEGDEALVLRAASELGSPSTVPPTASPPVPADPGSVYVVRKAVALHADSILYVLERASDRAQAWVEIRNRESGGLGDAANTTLMVKAIGTKLLLSDAGDEVTPAGTRRAPARRPAAAP